MNTELVLRLGILFSVILIAWIIFTLKKRKEMLKKIEVNCVKSELTWTNKKGEYSEIVYLKRSNLPLIGDWKRVYPLYFEDKLDKNGNPKVNKMNYIFGGKKNFIKLLITLAVIGLILLFVFNTIGSGREFLDGSKYVIVNKSLFFKYCDVGTPINILPNFTEVNILNLSN